MRGIMGAVLVVGLLAGCGGVEPVAETQDLGAQSQAVNPNPTCAAGYTRTLVWECPFYSTPQAPCHYVGYANQQHAYCSNGVDEYDAGPYGPVVCGDCY